MEIKAYFDGSCGPINPGGEMGIGVIIFEDDKEVYRCSDKVPEAPENTNNVAEYLAFIKILEFFSLKSYEFTDITIYGDSNLVVQQMNNAWKIREGHYKEHALQAKKLLQILKVDNNIKIEWIPREQNTLCDDLSKGINKKPLS